MLIINEIIKDRKTGFCKIIITPEVTDNPIAKEDKIEISITLDEAKELEILMNISEERE